MNGLTDYDELRANASIFVSKAIGIEPFDYQEAFLDADTDRRALVSGRQVGKTRMCAWAGLHAALTQPHALVLITAPSQRQSSIMFKQLRSEMGQSGIPDDAWGLERDTQTILEFDNGSEIHCLPTGRNGNKIRGFSADTIIVDEAAFIAESIFQEVLEPMTFATDGELVLASTPFGTSGYFYDKATKWCAEADTYSTWDPDTGGIASYENPLISPDDIERFKEGKTERQIRQEVEGRFVEDGAQFFNSGDIVSAMAGGTPEYNADSRVVLGADIAAAGSAETALVCGDGDGNIFKLETLPDAGVLDAADRITTLDRQYGFDQVVVDETGIGRGTAEDLARDPSIERKLEPVYLSMQKKQSVYQSLKSALESGDIYLPQDSDMRVQLESIGYETRKSGNLSIGAETGNDDLCDALALCVWGLPDTLGDTGARIRGSTEPVIANADPGGGKQHRPETQDHDSGRVGSYTGVTGDRAQDRSSRSARQRDIERTRRRR